MERFPLTSNTVLATRYELRAAGYSSRQITEGVRSRELIRIRRGHYGTDHTPTDVIGAVRIGGVLGCVNAAQSLGVWVGDITDTHVWLRREASRLRSPRNRYHHLDDHNRAGYELHWWSLIDPESLSAMSVGIVDALAQIVRCQPADLAVCSLDSALNKGLISQQQLDELFDQLPSRFRPLQSQVEARSMSGIETLVRLLALRAGFSVEPQAHFNGVGYVDLVINGCVVVETDGRRGHEEAESQSRDYDRDVELAVQGYTVLRFNYRQVMFHPELVLRAITIAVRMHRRGGIQG